MNEQPKHYRGAGNVSPDVNQTGPSTLARHTTPLLNNTDINDLMHQSR